jgi:uncharacterized protein YigE (DUF2233 family)
VNQKSFFIIILVLLLTSGLFCVSGPNKGNNDYVSYEVDLRSQDFSLYWKDDKGQPFKSIGALRTWLDRKGKRLLFAMNAGMYKPDNTPEGLLIQDQKLIVPLDTFSGKGNFYLKPNGIFYTTTDERAVICRTEDFQNSRNINYATQSGPMLVINGEIHPAFKEGSPNLNIRNGVGILPGGRVILAMSKNEVNFYDFASYFKSLGCKNALYLDGFVSRTYLPEKDWVQIDGDFGVIIAVTANK